MNRHALADETLRTRKTETALVLDEFAGRTDAAVAEVVNIVDLILADKNLEQQADSLNNIDTRLVESAKVLVDLAGQAETLVDLVATDITEIVVRQIEEHALKHLLGVGGSRRIARTHTLVDFLERILFIANACLGILAQGLDERTVVDGHIDGLDRHDAGSGDLLHQRRSKRIVTAGNNGLGISVDKVVLHHQHTQIALYILVIGRQLLEIVEQLHELLVAAVAECPQQGRSIEFTAAAALIHEAPHNIVGVQHHLDPVAAIGNDADRQQRLTVGVNLTLGRDAGAAVELRDDNALCAVDDECAIRSHDWHIAKEDLFLADILAILKTEGRLERTVVSFAIDERLQITLLCRLKSVANEIKLIAAVIGCDRENLPEDGLQTHFLTFLRSDITLKEILIRFRLDVDEIRHRRLHTMETSEDFTFCAHLISLPYFSVIVKLS